MNDSANGGYVSVRSSWQGARMTSQIQGKMISPEAGELLRRPRDAGDVRETNAPGPEPSTFDPMWQIVKRLPKYARLSAALVRDPRVPRSSKAMLAAGGAYLVSPIDLVPGFIPVAGQLDDLYVMLFGLRQAMRKGPDNVIEEHFAAAGLAPSIVDEDLATIRAFVRRGVRWSLRKGGQALTRVSRQATTFAQRTRQRRNAQNDQDPL